VLLVGLTGNFGMGKSAVLSVFQKLGALILDTDKIVESLLAEKDVLGKIRDVLGDAVFHKDDSLNKRKVADIIFRDEALRHSIEDILHPLVFGKIDLFLEKNVSACKVAVIEVPLLFERGYQERFDRTITVYCKEEEALARLGKEGINREDALLRLRFQLPVVEKIRRSHFAIDNNGSIAETERQAEKIYGRLVKEVEDGDNNRSRNLQQKLS
jgi:dephospho-CoA kinase